MPVSSQKQTSETLLGPGCGLCLSIPGIPVSDVSLKTRPPGGWVMEGNKLVLICSVESATGNITYLWYRGALGLNLETKTQPSLTAEFEISEVKQSDADQYYCAASNGHGHIPSELVNVSVRVPVSRPVLTFGDSGTQAVLGDLVELHCKALRGSPPIFYQFYHENIILGNSLAPSGGGASFSFSLTAEHSGNFSCEASNGQGAQRSEVVALNLTGLSLVPTEKGLSHLSSGLTVWLLGCLGPIIMALIVCYWLKRKIGRKSEDPLRSPPQPVLQESTYPYSPDPRQPEPVYENVNVVSGDEVYSLVYHTQQELEPAAAQHMRTHRASEVPSGIYSKPRINIAYMDYEDAM
ncbi:Fc receptor-like protein 1 isoform X2 [Grammomys surdaster]|uniref:Fc receptor-like protein 1 isoform X2 n=1 Tax=Grammomys surdaster TaxID=491861 RepID=UPI0010A033EE|nr:Fc receptor-like protein 1 isoform X2 [Grammomys surdaster]